MDISVSTVCFQRVPTGTLCYLVLSHRDIIDAIGLLNSNICHDPDGTHSKFITKVFSYFELVNLLKVVFTFSLSTGVVPKS